eukprot:c25261_g1_i1.p1 GENE.c25261_g1_i1~~c25261_g1_i1.p1  ORF type:complete len:151 (-),score=31.82 c25261_g1_i1:47-448(-)
MKIIVLFCFVLIYSCQLVATININQNVVVKQESIIPQKHILMGPIRPVAMTPYTYNDFYGELKKQLRVMNQGDVASLVFFLVYIMSKWNDVPTADVLIPMTMYKLLSTSDLNTSTFIPLFNKLTSNRPPNPPK